MLWLEPGHYARIQELPNGPHPLPLKSGFSLGMAYRIIGMFNPSESSEAYMILVNDREETWFISNRHVRICEPDAHRHGLRAPLTERTPALNTLNMPVPERAIYHAAE